MAKSNRSTVKRTRPEWEVWLWLATDGEVRAQPKIPQGGFDIWLGFVATPPLTQGDADTIMETLCDLSKIPVNESTREETNASSPRWLFRSDPRTQGDLRKQFEDAVRIEAAKREVR